VALRQKPDRLQVPPQPRILRRTERLLQLRHAQMLDNPRHARLPRLMARKPNRFPQAEESHRESIRRIPYDIPAARHEQNNFLEHGLL
jgi:hypothetical protein